MLLLSIKNTLSEVSDLLSQLSKPHYTSPCDSLSNATIGEHVRHIIEMFECLEEQYKSGYVNYDARKRDYLIETDVDFAKTKIETILKNLDKPNKKVTLVQQLDGDSLEIESNYFRELLYNLEHCIHHQALIKVAVIQNPAITIDPNFGVARSTIEYRKQCAQ
jgi:hypothetical protein